MSTSVYTGLNPFNFIRKHFLQICLCLHAQRLSKHTVLTAIAETVLYIKVAASSSTVISLHPSFSFVLTVYTRLTCMMTSACIHAHTLWTGHADWIV